MSLCPDHYTSPTISQLPSNPQRAIVDDSDKREVDWILDFKWRYGKLHYLIPWAGYSHMHMSWEPAEDLGNARELVYEFHREHPTKCWWWLHLEEWDWTFLWGYIFHSFSWISHLYNWCQHRYLPPTTAGGVLLGSESTMRLLIGHWSVVGLIKVVRRHTHLGFCCSYGFSLVYIHMWQPRGSAPKVRDDVTAVMIRFSPMAWDVSSAGYPQPYLDNLWSLWDR